MKISLKSENSDTSIDGSIYVSLHFSIKIDPYIIRASYYLVVPVSNLDRLYLEKQKFW